MAIEQTHEVWQREGIRAVGLFPFAPQAPVVAAFEQTESLDIQFEAARALLRCGVALAPEMLWEHALGGGPHAQAAAELACRNVPIDTATVWLSLAQRNPQNGAVTLAAIGATGCPRLVLTLLNALDDPKHAQLASYGLYMIAGLDLDEMDGYSVEPPDETGADLPFPNVALVRQWWRAHGHLLDPTQRWFLGRARKIEGLREALIWGKQHARGLAAHDLRRLRGAGTVPVNVSAPGWKQHRWLSWNHATATVSKFLGSSGRRR